LELRLLADPAFGEGFDAVVDEIADQYAGDELTGEERSRVERYFLQSEERQQKVRFASELQRHAAAERGSMVVNAPVPVESGWWERASLFWNKQALSLRFATIFATVIILVGVAMLVIPTRDSTSRAYASIALTISNSSRSAGAEVPSLKLQPGDAGIRVELKVPDGAPQGDSYRVNLTSEQGSRDLPVADQNGRSIVVMVPRSDIPPGSYTIQMFAVNVDGTEQRVPGSYFFTVE
jgi:methionine-rich copper-binding protein CopC